MIKPAKIITIKRSLFSIGILLNKAKKRMIPKPIFMKKSPIFEKSWPKSISSDCVAGF